MPPKKMEIMVPEKPMTRKEFITALETLKAQRPVYVPESPRSNPIGIYVSMFFGFLILAVALIWGLSSLKQDPTPFYPTPYIITLPAEKTLAPTITKTLTVTPDITATYLSSPAWQVIRDYFHFVSVADFGSAWGSLTTRCRNLSCWERFNNDYLAFQEWWRNWGKMEIRKLIPEILTDFDAQAFVTVYFFKDELTHDYRFYLKKVNGVWKVDRIEYVAPMK